MLILMSVFCIETFAQAPVVIRDVYKVKKKDTITGIAEMHGVTLDELMDANPEMLNPKFRLKKNMFIKIPEHRPVVVDTADEEPARIMKTYPYQTIKVGVMLPLTSSVEGGRMVEYYRGLLIGCDSLSHAGADIDIYTWDTPDSLDIHTVLAEPGVANLDIIFGPYYKQHEVAVSEFCKANEIKLVIPFKLKGGEVSPSEFTYQIYEPQEMQNQQAIQQYVNNLADCQPIFVSTTTPDVRKAEFFNGLKETLTKMGIKFRTCDITCTDEIFSTLFSATQGNAIIMSSSTSNDLKTIFAKLDFVRANRPGVKISMYGYVDFLIYENTYRLKYHTYDTYVPSLFYYNNSQSKLASFEKRYEEWFHGNKLQTKFMPRVGFTGYDHAQYFLQGLHKMGSDFNGLAGQSKYESLQTPLNFTVMDGVMQNNYFQVVHYDTDRSIEILIPEE